MAEAISGDVFCSMILSEDMLGDDLEEWLNDSSIMKRAFRHCAIISGLVEKRFPGSREKAVDR